MSKRVIEQVMDLKRETKRTYRFETDDANEDACGVVYIKKTAFPSKPASIRLLVEVD